MRCAWIDDDEQCDREGELYGPNLAVPLCRDEHLPMVFTWRESRAAGAITKLYDELPDTQHADGWAYVLHLLDDGLVKVGHSRSLERRLQDLTRKLGRLRVLAVIPGGWTVEALLHKRFEEFRVSNMFSERFIPANELMNFAQEAGIDPEAKPEVQSYLAWAARRD